VRIDNSRATDAVAASAHPAKKKDPLTTAVNESSMWAALDSNQRLPPCEDASTTTEKLAQQGLASTPSAACTRACPGEAENANAESQEADPLAELAAELAKLSPSERQRLAAMLTGQQGDQEEAGR
jgi:hypothetical protein